MFVHKNDSNYSSTNNKNNLKSAIPIQKPFQNNERETYSQNLNLRNAKLNQINPFCKTSTPQKYFFNKPFSEPTFTHKQGKSPNNRPINREAYFRTPSHAGIIKESNTFLPQPKQNINKKRTNQLFEDDIKSTSVFSELVQNKVLILPSAENDFLARSGMVQPEDRKLSEALLNKKLPKNNVDLSNLDICERILHHGPIAVNTVREGRKMDTHFLSVLMQLQLHEEWRLNERQRYSRLILRERTEKAVQKLQIRLKCISDEITKTPNIKNSCVLVPNERSDSVKSVKSPPIKSPPRRASFQPKIRVKKNVAPGYECRRCKRDGSLEPLEKCSGCVVLMHPRCVSNHSSSDLSKRWFCTVKCQKMFIRKIKRERKELEKKTRIEKAFAQKKAQNTPKRLWEKTEELFHPEKVQKAVNLAKENSHTILETILKPFRSSGKVFGENAKDNGGGFSESLENEKMQKNAKRVLEEDKRTFKGKFDANVKLTVSALLRRNPGRDENESGKKAMRSFAKKYYEPEGSENMIKRPYITMRSLKSWVAAEKGFAVNAGSNYIFPPQKYDTDIGKGFFHIRKTLNKYNLQLEKVTSNEDAKKKNENSDGFIKENKRAMELGSEGSLKQQLIKTEEFSEIGAELWLLREELRVQKSDNEGTLKSLFEKNDFSFLKTKTNQNAQQEMEARVVISEYKNMINSKIS